MEWVVKKWIQGMLKFLVWHWTEYHYSSALFETILMFFFLTGFGWGKHQLLDLVGLYSDYYGFMRDLFNLTKSYDELTISSTSPTLIALLRSLLYKEPIMVAHGVDAEKCHAPALLPALSLLALSASHFGKELRAIRKNGKFRKADIVITFLLTFLGFKILLSISAIKVGASFILEYIITPKKLSKDGTV